MENILHIDAQFKSVFLLNGTFTEKADKFRYDLKNRPIYITVLPLSAHHLPYTVKVFDGKALSNEPLCDVYSLPDNHYYIKLKPRYGYVYSKAHREPPKTDNAVIKFFNLIKDGNVIGARTMLTNTLSMSVPDADLNAFFDDYTDIIENTFNPQDKNALFLINKQNQGILFRFEFDGNLIDNIIQI